MDTKMIGYCRVSTEEQVRTGISLEFQEAKIRDYAKLNDFELNQTIRDEGESGKNLNRTGIQEVIRLIRAKKIEGIIVYKLDRICRNTRDMLNLIEMFERHGIAFHSITEKIDTKTAIGKFFITILSAFAQMERDLISERVRGVLRYKRQIGQRAGEIPYGYRLGDKKSLVSIPNEQKILEEIKDLRKDGCSYEVIAALLNSRKIRTKKGKEWFPATVHSVLEHMV